ncbi:MAG: cobalamin-binding protein [Candidatus Aminicenantes bacterium]|nr:cobalamin-binding protein [Candidatus Aminicenantes bacterium]
MGVLEQIASDIVKGNSESVHALTQQAVDENIATVDILNNGLVAGMNVVSEQFKNNEIFIPEVLISARAMKAGMEIIRPLLAEAQVEPRGRVILGTVQGDLHDIGKNIVAMLLEGAGFDIIDLGADVPIEKFVESAKNEGADIIGMSALLTTTMVNMRPTIEALENLELKKGLKVMIGGAPITQTFANEIHADGYAPDAAEAVDLAFSLMGAAPKK